MIVLPLYTEAWRREIVIGLRTSDGGCGNLRFRPCAHRFSDTVHVDVHTDDRPTVFPMGGLQVHDTTYRIDKLKMIEPPLPVGRIDQSPLMRAVYVGATLLHHHFLLIRAVNIT